MPPAALLAFAPGVFVCEVARAVDEGTTGARNAIIRAESQRCAARLAAADTIAPASTRATSWQRAPHPMAPPTTAAVCSRTERRERHTNSEQRCEGAKLVLRLLPAPPLPLPTHSPTKRLPRKRPVSFHSAYLRLSSIWPSPPCLAEHPAAHAVLTNRFPSARTPPRAPLCLSPWPAVACRSSWTTTKHTTAWTSTISLGIPSRSRSQS